MRQLSLFESPETSWTELPFLVIDTETTGLDAKQNRVIEWAWVLFENQQISLSEARLCAITESIPAQITEITGISDQMLHDQVPFSEHIADFLKAASKAAFWVAYNAPFDHGFLSHEFTRAGQQLPEAQWIDPCVFIRELDRYQKGKKLEQAAKRWGVSISNAHRALADATATGHLLLKLIPKLPTNSLVELAKLQDRWRQQQKEQYELYKSKLS